MSGVTDADRERGMAVLLAAEEYAHVRQRADVIAAALAEEREKGIDIGLRNATSIDHYEVGHCCRLCGQTWPCDRAETVGLR